MARLLGIFKLYLLLSRKFQSSSHGCHVGACRHHSAVDERAIVLSHDIKVTTGMRNVSKLEINDSFLSIYKYNPLYQLSSSRLIASSQVGREFRCECQKTKMEIRAHNYITYSYILSSHSVHDYDASNTRSYEANLLPLSEDRYPPAPKSN